MPALTVTLLSRVTVVPSMLSTVVEEIGELGSTDVTFAPIYTSGFSTDSSITFVFVTDCAIVACVLSTTS